ncbi:hypothetical protein SAMN05192529_101341 [Arachidicoccus rhizosphaerae]|uniref:Uncharacterized protein n=1 Tax=Arachidicoccus rhizosphaerae TaxID=551991 RepID=A0A1H3VPI2_9BACT|nr:hypothetical protein [Arachidicoccus rhizosphaerae]SDZ76723.1 hypothetical protein SAMN05192529_101341 [Arachidicoccus rhizosphaerae]
MDNKVRNNTGLLGKKELIDGFVANQRVLDIILLELRGTTYNGPLQCYLVIGEHGIGKTMLLWRIKYAIEDDLELSNLIVPVIFKEEQYFLGDLETLWNYVASQIECFPLPEKKDTAYSVEILFEKANEESAYYKLEKMLKERSKKVILFIENLDAFFRKIGKNGQQRLREVLSTSRDIRIIGSATSLFNEVSNYHLPFYEYLKVIQLKGLNRKEAEHMYAKTIEPSLKSKKEEQIPKRYSARIEALRRLTKGNPRLMGYMYQSMQNGSNNGVDDIFLLLDLLTLRYKTEMEQMPYQQQRVIDYIAGRLDAVAVKDIVHGTGMESKYISSILSTLRKNKAVDKIETDSKNHLYRIHDFLFNMWYNLRYGNMADAAALIRFCEVWIGIKDQDGDTEEAISSESTIIQFPGLNNLRNLKSANPNGFYKSGEVQVAIDKELQNISNQRFDDPYMAVVYATLIIDQGYFECPCHLLTAHEDKIAFVMDGTNEADKQKLVRELISFFIKLLTKNQYNWAMQLFAKGKETFRVWLRPIYFACLRLLKEEYPTDVLKSAPALDSTIQEILEEIKRA